MPAKIIYDNDILNHPEILKKAFSYSPDLYKSVVELGAEGFSSLELNGLVELYV